MVLLLLFLSGLASLFYQILWTRELGLILGGTMPATSTVLAAFMCGLGIGSILLGRVADRVTNPIRLYAYLEIGIAAGALLVDLAFQALPSIYGPLYGARESGLLFHSARFVVLFAILCVPTILMGGTLPAVGRFIIGSGRAGSGAAAVYAVNTLGAAAGAFAAVFIFIEGLGVSGTFWLAIAINLSAGLLAFLLPAGAGIHRPQQAATPPPPAVNTRLPLLIYATSGFVALGLEIAWTRALIFSIGTATYAFGMMLAVLLAGIAIGGLIAASRVVMDRPARAIIVCQAVVAVSAICTVWLATDIATWIRSVSGYTDGMTWPAKVGIQFIQTAVLMLIPAAAFGALFPLATELYVRTARIGTGLGTLLGVNTIAAIGGALLTGFVFIPTLGIYQTTLLLGTMAALGLAVSLYSFRTGPAAAGAVLAWGVLLVFMPNRFVLEPVLPTQKLLYYEEGRNGTISVVEDFSGDRSLMIDHIAVAGTDPIFMTDQKSLAHLPMILRPSAKRALTVGFGSGGATYSFSLYPQLEAIDVAEIDDAVLGAAPFFKATNGDALQDPRVRIVRDDARSYLRYTPQRYDVITTDCTDLRYRSNAQLYTREFFDSARKALTPNGMVVAWVPLGGLSTTDLQVVIRTFVDVFSHSSAWYMYNYPTHYLLLVGAQLPLEPLRADLKPPEPVRRDLASIQLDDVRKFAASYIKNHAQLVEFAGDLPVNSDDQPYLEFSVPKGRFNTIAENLAAMLQVVADPAEMLPSDPSLGTVIAARDLMLEGHILYNRSTNQYHAAAALYSRAAKISNDPALNTLIQRTLSTSRARTDEYLALSRTRPGDALVHNELGLLREDQGDVAGALNSFRRAVQAAPGEPIYRHNLGRALDRSGSLEEAAAEYETALKLDSSYVEALNNLGIVYLQQARYTDAISAFERTVRMQPGSATSWLNLGLSAQRSDQLPRARSAYDRAIELDPRNADARINRSVVRLAGGDPDGAEADLHEALRLRPDSAEIRYNLGIVAEHRGATRLAEEHYGAAIELNPKHVLAHNNLGILLSRSGRLREAINLYARAIQLDPRNPQLRNNVGMEYARTGDFQKAIVEYEEAIRLEPKMFEPYANLALIYLRLNRRTEAERYIAAAQQLNPTFKLP